MMRLNIDYGDIRIYAETEGDLVRCLREMYNAIGDIPYKIIGANTDAISKIISDNAANSFISAYSAVKASDLKKHCPKEYWALCENMLIEGLIRKYYPNLLNSDLPKLSKPKFNNKLIFANDSKDWIIIKKMSVGPKTNPREAAAFLFSVKASIFSKLLESVYENASNKAEKLTKGKRRSAKSLLEIYELTGNGEDEGAFMHCLCMIGYEPTPGHKTLKKVFPELKLPGIKGRKPKK